MSEENEIPQETPAAAAPAASPAPEAVEALPERKMVMCMVSKKMVPLDETIELERKKGEVLRIHERYKRFES